MQKSTENISDLMVSFTYGHGGLLGTYTQASQHSIQNTEGNEMHNNRFLVFHR